LNVVADGVGHHVDFVAELGERALR
jgi:hypothetical protein